MEHPSLDPQISASIKAFFEILTKKGHSVEAIDFKLLEYVVPTYYILTTAEASSNLSRFDGIKYGYQSASKNADLTELYKQTRSQGFGDEVKRRIMLGSFVLSSGYYDAYFTRAQQVRKILSDQVNQVFSSYNIILSPTVPAPAFNIGEKSDNPIKMFLTDIYTVFANLVGIPAISIPLFKHSNGMPFGLQLMVSHFDEVSLLALSKEMMQYKQHSY